MIRPTNGRAHLDVSQVSGIEAFAANSAETTLSAQPSTATARPSASKRRLAELHVEGFDCPCECAIPEQALHETKPLVIEVKCDFLNLKCNTLAGILPEAPCLKYVAGPLESHPAAQHDVVVDIEASTSTDMVDTTPPPRTAAIPVKAVTKEMEYTAQLLCDHGDLEGSRGMAAEASDFRPKHKEESRVLF
ncbi:unnamed protein product [Prorocentrum cordatum]|uniref:Uncharacterized protein n=1 Tax=Prorocentrum cordatum TaxID=2364126 RepID=A0ABN9SVC9_9DINO|nr:unnamed protein product [Polarella glacialis]